jgi:hypothetical protein
MTRQDFLTAYRAFRRRVPFQRFLLELVSGDRLLLAHPEALTTRGDLIHCMSPRRRSHLFTCSSVCQLLDIPEEGAG